MLTLQAQNLTIGASVDGTVVPAIRDLSFDLAPGKILGLVGESGAGKTMVGRAIAQLLPQGFAVTSGALLFEGIEHMMGGGSALAQTASNPLSTTPNEVVENTTVNNYYGNQGSDTQFASTNADYDDGSSYDDV